MSSVYNTKKNFPLECLQDISQREDFKYENKKKQLWTYFLIVFIQLHFLFKNETKTFPVDGHPCLRPHTTNFMNVEKQKYH